MTTVTAKSLRNNLSEYLDKLENGEEIVIIRHSTIIGSLKPVSDKSAPNGHAVSAMLERNKDSFKNHTHIAPISVRPKDLYHQAIDEKYDV